MTAEQLWHVAAKVLGAYFLVLGALYLPGAIVAGGMGLPEGTSRAAFVALPIVQAAIALLSGFFLVRAAGRMASPTSAPVDSESGTAVALQLLGVFFVVTNLSAAAGHAIDFLYPLRHGTSRSGTPG